MTKKLFTTHNIVLCGIVAAAYFALVAIFQLVSFGPFQVRVAEMLTVMPFFFPVTAFGLFVGCFFANLIFSPFGIIDALIGGTASLVAGLIVANIRIKWLVPVAPIVLNAFAVPIVFLAAGEAWAPYFIMAALVGGGQVLACAGFGFPLLLTLERIPIVKQLRHNPDKKTA
ncbi:MAG: QueT transporter family protein [Oscillospiraceae bacterium]|nr:QueT transporter family protein [Oscillospiraceae bacterium]